MFLLLPFPDIDPIIFEIGPLAVRWYSLAYVVGLLLAWRYCRWLAARSPWSKTPEALESFKVGIDDFLFWATLGVILGGRLGFVLFYNLDFYLENPHQIIFLWEGGMSFHGGLLGVMVAMIWFARARGIPLFNLTDIIATAAPIGLFLGRLANYINGELYGRPTEFWAATIFPTDPFGLPRHPSQLYEAGLEGFLLFFLLFGLILAGALSRPGRITGLFLMGYALSRLAVELVREPDAQLGLLFGGVTMGQLLSLPMLLGGFALVVWSLRRPAEPGPATERGRS